MVKLESPRSNYRASQSGSARSVVSGASDVITLACSMTIIGDRYGPLFPNVPSDAAAPDSDRAGGSNAWPTNPVRFAWSGRGNAWSPRVPYFVPRLAVADRQDREDCLVFGSTVCSPKSGDAYRNSSRAYCCHTNSLHDPKSVYVVKNLMK